MTEELTISGDSESWKLQFVRLLENSTFGRSLAEKAYELKNANLPPRLFKYFRCNRYSLDGLQNNTVWLCSPANYNDPFDCVTKASLDRIQFSLLRALIRKFFVDRFQLHELDPLPARLEPWVGESIRSFLNRVIESYKGFVPSRDIDFDTLKERLATRVPNLAHEAREKALQFRGLTKVSSFTERNASILMWSHYAENHQGFCLEYDVSQMPKGHQFKQTIVPIIYSTKLYDSTPLIENWIEGPRRNFNPLFPLLPFIHKAQDWSYEREWRLIFVSSEPNHSWGTPPPSRIFLGARIASSYKEQIQAILSGREIEIHQMSMSTESFSLVSARIS